MLQGAEAVSAYVTHGVFPNQSWRRFTKCNGTADAFKYFWMTDSCPRTVQAVEGQAPYEIIQPGCTNHGCLADLNPDYFCPVYRCTLHITDLLTSVLC